jgi:4-nitrophenyl phosphatase
MGTVVFDLDGVVYVDSDGVPGAGDALRAIEDAGWHLVFATNNSTKTPKTVLQHIEARTGFASDDASVVTSAMAAGRWAKAQHTRAFVVGEPGLTATLEDEGLTVVDDASADCVIVGLDRDITYNKIDFAAKLVRNGAAYIATNADATYPTQTGPAPGAGAIVAAVTTASGVQPVACGKPHVPMLSLVRDVVVGESIWVVGDRPETDLALARRAGWTAVLVLTGVTDVDTVISSDHAPHHTLKSIRDLPRLISARSRETTDNGR